MTATAGAQNATLDGRLAVIAAMAAAINLNTALQAVGVYAIAPYGIGPFALNLVPLAELGIVASSDFTIMASGTGLIAPGITATGAQLPPSTSLDGVTTIFGYLNILDGLDGAHASASQNLDTSKADVWTARNSEIAQRQALYRHWQMRLSDFVGIPINPSRRNRYSAAGALRYA